MTDALSARQPQHRHIAVIGRDAIFEYLRDRVEARLAQAHVHVCPSLSPGDSFPNVILDAKQAGLPSIVFPTAGLPEALTDGVDGVVTSAPTAEALSASLLDILRDDERRDRMAAAARASLSAFDADALTDQWLSLFLKRA